MANYEKIFTENETENESEGKGTSKEMLETIHEEYQKFRVNVGLAAVKHHENPFVILMSTLAGSLEYELDLMTESGKLDKEKVNKLRMRICSDLLPK